MRPSPALVIAVAAGSAMGAVSRCGLSSWLMVACLDSFPWPSFAVNILGSLLIGLLAGIASVSAQWKSSVLQQAFWLPGFCGGFTSFSIFSLDSVQLLMSGQNVLAALYVLASLLLWLAGVSLGWCLGRLAASTGNQSGSR